VGGGVTKSRSDYIKNRSEVPIAEGERGDAGTGREEEQGQGGCNNLWASARGIPVIRVSKPRWGLLNLILWQRGVLECRRV